MKYRYEPMEESGVKYILEGGIFKKRYVAKETNNGFYLRKKKILDVADTPKFYLKAFVYDNVPPYP